MDIAACLHPVAQLWEQLSWPDSEEAFMLMVKLTEVHTCTHILAFHWNVGCINMHCLLQDVCKIASTYCQMLKARVKALSVDSDRESAIKMVSWWWWCGVWSLTLHCFSLIICMFYPNFSWFIYIQLCVVVNDLEHLHTVLTRLPQQLNWAGLRERTRHVIGDTQFQNTLPSQLQHTQSALNREIRSAVETLGKKVA